MTPATNVYYLTHTQLIFRIPQRVETSICDEMGSKVAKYIKIITLLGLQMIKDNIDKTIKTHKMYCTTLCQHHYGILTCDTSWEPEIIKHL